MSSGDWDKLSEDQQEAVNAWRNRTISAFIAETETFEKEHPELRLTWNIVTEPLIRADHPVVLEEL